MKIFRCNKEIDPIEERFQAVVELVKDLPRSDYNRLKEGMDLAYSAYEKMRKVQTVEEKAIEKEAKANADIETIEKVIEKEDK